MASSPLSGLCRGIRGPGPGQGGLVGLDSWGTPSHCGPATLGLVGHQDLRAWGFLSSGEALVTGSWVLQMKVLGPGRKGKGTGSEGLVVCGPLLGMHYTGYTCPAGPGALRTEVLAAVDHCRVRCTFPPRVAWLEDRSRHPQDACSSAAVVDTFLAADLDMGHQGELLGQGTDWSRSHAAAVVEGGWASTSLCRLQKASCLAEELLVPCCRLGPFRALVFGHIHKGTVAADPSACCPWDLQGLCCTVHPYHYWGLVA